MRFALRPLRGALPGSALLIRRLLAGAILAGAILAGARPLAAQPEAALRRFFEGKQVRVRLDMPASHYGVDVRPRQEPAVDFPAYGQRIKQFGVALYEGDTARITAVKVKDRIIEFQLDGGGYGTWGDESANVASPVTGRTDRERQLDREIERETDPRRRDQLRRQRSMIEDARRRQERWDQQRADELRERKAERVAQNRLRGGSRFNIRYPENYLKETVPAPEDLMTLLEPYVDFGELQRGAASTRISPGTTTRPTSAPPTGSPAAARAGAAPASTPAAAPAAAKKTLTLTGASPIFKLKRGMTRGEVESLLGGPAQSTRRSKEGSQDVETDVWEMGGAVYEVSYVNDIVVRYQMAAK